MIKPKALKRGDTVAIVSLSAGMGAKSLLSIDIIQALED